VRGVLKLGLITVRRLDQQRAGVQIADHLDQRDRDREGGRDAEIGGTDQTGDDDVADEGQALAHHLAHADRRAAEQYVASKSHQLRPFLAGQDALPSV
jgi:hypothetical protein